MVAAAIYGTRWEKNRKEKENKTLHGLSRRWAGQDSRVARQEVL